MNEKIYTGSSKSLYRADDEYTLIMSFDDNLHVANHKVLDVSGKGAINNNISAYLMERLDIIGVDNHLIEKHNMRQQLIQFVDVYPIQVHISTVACDRYVKNFGIEDGLVFEAPIIDFRVKNKELQYPNINESQILSFGWLNDEELSKIKQSALRIHDFLSGLFSGIQIRLVEVKLEFGRIFNGETLSNILVDEISPDTCRLWDMNNNQKLCYELANETQDTKKIIAAYQEVLHRLNIGVV